jgi:2-oxo-4-hydroxy-4-carboxy-5-ureidoimidazoline decarboxylase
LVYSQEFSDINDAIRAERQIKGWSRKKKEALIAGDFKLLHELAKCKNETHYSRHDEQQRAVVSVVEPRTMTGLGSHPSTSLRVTQGLLRVNSLSNEECEQELKRCCGSSSWVRKMILQRPFASSVELFEKAESIWWSLSETDWREAFAHHPQIGDIENLRKKFATTANWASSEQAGATNAPEEILNALAEGNKEYEEKFGYIFIVCATGKSAEEMLQILKSRLPNSPEVEIKIAATEQAKITRLRLEKLLDVK